MTSTSDGPDARTALGRSPLGEERIKHLEFIQAVINRMATNSFFVKGWVLTLAAGLLTVSASRLSWQIAVVGLVPLLCFWSLDGYFLQQERLFRHLYDDVRHVDSAVEPMSMNIGPYLARTSFLDAALSRTLLLFHGALLAADLAVLLTAAL
jgi:hypothetical protein